MGEIKIDVSTPQSGNANNKYSMLLIFRLEGLI